MGTGRVQETAQPLPKKPAVEPCAPMRPFAWRSSRAPPAAAPIRLRKPEDNLRKPDVIPPHHWVSRSKLGMSQIVRSAIRSSRPKGRVCQSLEEGNNRIDVLVVVRRSDPFAAIVG